jgi:hypothetical protein
MQQLDTDLIVEEGAKVRESGVWLFPPPTTAITPQLFDTVPSQAQCDALRHTNANLDKTTTQSAHIETAIGCHGMLQDEEGSKYKVLSDTICTARSEHADKVVVERLMKWDLYLDPVSKLLVAGKGADRSGKTVGEILKENAGQYVFLNVKEINNQGIQASKDFFGAKLELADALKRLGAETDPQQKALILLEVENAEKKVEEKERISIESKTTVDLSHHAIGDVDIDEVVLHSWPETYAAQDDWYFDVELTDPGRTLQDFTTDPEASVRGFKTFLIPTKRKKECYVSIFNEVYDLNKKAGIDEVLDARVFLPGNMRSLCSDTRQDPGDLMPDLTERFFMFHTQMYVGNLGPWLAGGPSSVSSALISSSGIGYDSVFVMTKNSEGNFDKEHVAIFDFAPEVLHHSALLTYNNVYTATTGAGNEVSFTRVSMPLKKDKAGFEDLFGKLSKDFDRSYLHKDKSVYFRLDLGHTAYLMQIRSKGGQEESFKLTLADVLAKFFGDGLCAGQMVPLKE